MNNSAIGKSWEEVRAELFSPQELKEMENKVKLMHRLTVFRKKTISLRLSPSALEKAKSLGKGYTSILSTILEQTLADKNKLKQFLS